MPATLEAIFIAAAKKQPLVGVAAARVIAGVGIEGDRYATGGGTLSKRIEEGDAGRHVTVIEAEAIHAALAEFGEDFAQGRSRRNLVVRGLPLNGLIYRRIQIGDSVILRGDRHCHPCGLLSRLTSTGATRSLKMRGGLRTSVLVGGTIRVGDAVVVLDGNR